MTRALDLVWRKRYGSAIVVAALLAGAILSSVVTASVNGGSESQHVLRLSDGTILTVGGPSDFASEIECDSAGQCRPVSGAPAPAEDDLERYLLVGSVEPGSQNAGAFGFSLGGSPSQEASLTCIKVEEDAYTCDPTGKTRPGQEAGIYLHE